MLECSLVPITPCEEDSEVKTKAVCCTTDRLLELLPLDSVELLLMELQNDRLGPPPSSDPLCSASDAPRLRPEVTAENRPVCESEEAILTGALVTAMPIPNTRSDWFNCPL
jgi:hypothetical protein